MRSEVLSRWPEGSLKNKSSNAVDSESFHVNSVTKHGHVPPSHKSPPETQKHRKDVDHSAVYRLENYSKYLNQAIFFIAAREVERLLAWVKAIRSTKQWTVSQNSFSSGFWVLPSRQRTRNGALPSRKQIHVSGVLECVLRGDLSFSASRNCVIKKQWLALTSTEKLIFFARSHCWDY